MGWNQFQFYQYKSLVKFLSVEHDCTYILIDKGENLVTFGEDVWAMIGSSCRRMKNQQLYLLDVEYDVIVCQTEFANIENIKQAKLVMLQYGLAKNPHNYGSWRALADLNLVYGQYSYDRISPLSRAVLVGNPRYSDYFSGTLSSEVISRYKQNLTKNKKTILYAPTWGDINTVEIFHTCTHAKPLAPLRVYSGGKR